MDFEAPLEIVISNQNQDLEYVSILYDFVSKLARDSRDLDLDIANALDDHFWELI